MPKFQTCEIDLKNFDAFNSETKMQKPQGSDRKEVQEAIALQQTVDQVLETKYNAKSKEFSIPDDLEHLREVIFLMPLYSFDAKGKMRVWMSGVNGTDYINVSGMVFVANGTRGKLKVTAPKEIKANTRVQNAEDQAMNYAKQQWDEKQRKDSYFPSETIPDKDMTNEKWLALHGDVRKWPAVCYPWKDANDTDRRCTPENPWNMQFKLDGDRAMAWFVNGQVKLFSRTCLELKLKDHIRIQLSNLFQAMHFILTGSPNPLDTYDFGLDGELWIPHHKHHQDSHGVVARQKTAHKDEELVCFALFDIMRYDMNAQQRTELLRKAEDFIREGYDLPRPAKLEMNQKALCIGGDFENIFFVPTTTAVNDDEVDQCYDDARALGFEGIVMRRQHHMYPKAKEQKNVLMMKRKPVEDHEFEVIGFKAAQGDRAGCVVWMFRNDVNDETFEAQQTGPLEYQRELFRRGEDYIGRKLTVLITERSKSGTPKQGRVIKHRLDEDLALANDI